MSIRVAMFDTNYCPYRHDNRCNLIDECGKSIPCLNENCPLPILDGATKYKSGKMQIMTVPKESV